MLMLQINQTCISLTAIWKPSFHYNIIDMNQTRRQEVFVWIRFIAFIVSPGWPRLTSKVGQLLVKIFLSHHFPFSEVKPFQAWPIWARLSGSWLTCPRVAGISVSGSSQRAWALDRPGQGWEEIPSPENSRECVFKNRNGTPNFRFQYLGVRSSKTESEVC